MALQEIMVDSLVRRQAWHLLLVWHLPEWALLQVFNSKMLTNQVDLAAFLPIFNLP